MTNLSSTPRDGSSSAADLPAPRLGLPAPLTPDVMDPVLMIALAEDVRTGDITTMHSVPDGARARARLVAKANGVLAGLDVFVRTFVMCDGQVQVERFAKDGDVVQVGQDIATLEGSASGLLLAERTALNVLQRLSGVATLTRRYIEAVAHVPGTRILDTRKTTPGLRLFEKHAVRCGGGENHRIGLFDEAMIKENHLDLSGRDLESLVQHVRASIEPGTRITAEARDAEEAHAAVRGGADVVLIDNIPADELVSLCVDLRALAHGLGHKVELEASGGIHLQTVAGVAEAGVDRISIGALTHSAPALDLSLYLEPLNGTDSGRPGSSA
jgi:nicotinate-nucleotide pyrophosphorylase (carboxylating)